ncbi:MAG TPA: hypothetical protein VMM15_16980 [Bradyrhizobium sp.]|nr:hypothetical protein [Bradyrhizobium sp.]
MSVQHFEQDQFFIACIMLFLEERYEAGAAMRGMIQKWIVLKDNETVWDVALDATIALLGAAALTQLVQLIFSTP